MLIVGNSHVWSIVGWSEHSARDSTPMHSTDPHDASEVIGFAVTGGTSHNLIEPSSDTMAGAKVRDFLLSHGPRPTLVVFGDVDLRWHVRGPEMLRTTLDRYVRYLESIEPLCSELLVSSITGAHSALVECDGWFGADDIVGMMGSVRTWDSLLRRRCLVHGWTFVDLLSPFVGEPSVDGMNHLGGDAVRLRMWEAVRSARSCARPGPSPPLVR